MTNPLVLIIEDDDYLAHIFSLTLQSAEFKTEVIKDGQEALVRLAQTTPAVVVLDLHLPNVSGKEILQTIRTDERLAKTRVILATADAAMAENLQEEADIVLLKPISTTQLRSLTTRLRPSDD